MTRSPPAAILDWQSAIGSINLRIAIIKAHREAGLISATEAMDRIAAWMIRRGVLNKP